jgi:hypothetical protein
VTTPINRAFLPMDITPNTGGAHCRSQRADRTRPFNPLGALVHRVVDLHGTFATRSTPIRARHTSLADRKVFNASAVASVVH